MDYLLLIEQIELEDEYRSMLLTEGVIGSIISTIKRALTFIKDKICGILKKIIGIFKKDKKDGGGNSKPSSSNKNDVKVSTKVTNNKPKQTSPSNTNPTPANKDKNDSVKVATKVTDNIQPTKNSTTKTKMVYSYDAFIKFMECISTFVINNIADEITDFSSEEARNVVDRTVDAIDYISNTTGDVFDGNIQDINNMLSDPDIIDKSNDNIFQMNKLMQILKNINNTMINIGPDVSANPKEINEICKKIASHANVYPDTIKRNPNILYTQIAHNSNLYNLTDVVYNEIIKYNKYAQETCSKLQSKLSILENRLNNDDTSLTSQGLEFLKLTVDMFKQLGIAMISIANTLIGFKSKCFNIAVTNFR